MLEYQTKIIINAPVEKVWQTITRSDLYQRFDPNCIKIDGQIGLGQKLKVYSKLSPNRAFSVKVTRFSDNDSMVWESGLPFNLFKGVRTFKVMAKDDHTSEFSMSECFSGHLLGLFRKHIPDMSEAFDKFSAGLKQYIEDHR